MTARAQNRLFRSNDVTADSVSVMLAEMQITAASVAAFHFGPPWGLEMNGFPYIFIAREGLCRLRLTDGRWTDLKPGDCLIAVRGDPARLGSGGGDGDCHDIAEIWRRSGGPAVSASGYHRPVSIAWGGPDKNVRLLGATMTFSRGARDAAIMKAAPNHILLRADEARIDHWADALDRLLEEDEAQPRDGFLAICAAAVQLVATQLLRAYLNGAGEMAGVAHGGNGLARLIRALRLEPGKAWSIAAMAKEAGMSRTRFIQRFGELTGRTPAGYLLTCRMDYAAHALANGRQSVAALAQACGYASERAFRSAFYSMYAMSPRDYRQRHGPARGLDTSGAP